MADPELARLIALDTPKLNPLIANGLAGEHMRYLEPYVDEVFNMVGREFPDGFKYVGCKRCTPLEEYREASKKSKSKCTIDIARSNFYLMRYEFEFMGIPKIKYIYLPFVTDSCIMYVNNSRWLVSPVLADRVLSPGEDNIFVRLLRARFYLYRESHHFKINGQRHITQVVWSMIYNRPEKVKKMKATVKMNCALMHYLLAKYGFREAFQRFGKTSPIIGTLADVNEENYPLQDWVIVHSAHSPIARPKGAAKGHYMASQLAIAFPREEFTPMVKSMAGAFFYVVDRFPDRFETPGIPFDRDIVDDPRTWVILLGHIIFSGTVHEGKLGNDIDAHLVSLDDYLDELINRRLAEIDIHVKDVYEFFAVMIESFDHRLREGRKNLSNMYDKELSIVPFMLHELVVLIFKMNFKLKAAEKKGLKEKDVDSALNIVSSRKLFNLPKECGCLTTTSTPGDNKAFKLTSILIPQSRSHKASSKNERMDINDPTKYLHVSVAEICGYSNIPKSEPSGRERINPCVEFDPRGKVLRDKSLQPLLDSIQEDIRRQ